MSTAAWPLFGIYTSVHLDRETQSAPQRSREVVQGDLRITQAPSRRENELHGLSQARFIDGNRAYNVPSERAPHLVLERARWRQVQGQRSNWVASYGENGPPHHSPPFAFAKTLAWPKPTPAGLRNEKKIPAHQHRHPRPPFRGFLQQRSSASRQKRTKKRKT